MKTILTMAIATALFIAGTAAAETLRRPVDNNGFPQVWDSRGRRIGPMVSPNLVLIEINGQWFALPVGTSGFYPGGTAQMVFESSNCSGTPYMHAQGDSMIQDNEVVSPERYLVFPGKNLVHLYAHSTMPCTDPSPYVDSDAPTTSGPAPCTPMASTEMDAAPLEVVDLTRLSLKPPFSFK